MAVHTLSEVSFEDPLSEVIRHTKKLFLVCGTQLHTHTHTHICMHADTACTCTHMHTYMHAHSMHRHTSKHDIVLRAVEKYDCLVDIVWMMCAQ